MAANPKPRKCFEGSCAGVFVFQFVEDGVYVRVAVVEVIGRRGEGE